MFGPLSTIPPPLNGLSNPSILSTTEPPRSSTQESLRSLADDRSPITLRNWRLYSLMAAGHYGSLSPRRRTPVSMPTAVGDELTRMRDHSRDVMLMLASRGFWAGTQVGSSGPWTATSDLPSLDIGFTQGPFSRTLTIPAERRADYVASVRAVPTTMQSAAPGTGLRVAAEAQEPQLMFALVLGMLRSPDAYRYTAALIDVVTAHVAVAVQAVKHQVLVPRPGDPGFGAALPPTLLPMPGYSAYPSGHSAICHALAAVLDPVIDATAPQRAALSALAGAVAKNREAAGLHCEMDTVAGQTIGSALGGWMVQAAQDPGLPVPSWSAMFAAAQQEWL